MSKVDALRALREARYNAAAAHKPAAEVKAAKAPTTRVRRPVSTTEPAGTATDACGHRNMSGRSCTRPQGHAETSHRYTPKP